MKLSGVIYMHRISDFKMGGISRRNFHMFRSLCGEKTLKNVVSSAGGTVGRVRLFPYWSITNKILWFYSAFSL